MTIINRLYPTKRNSCHVNSEISVTKKKKKLTKKLLHKKKRARCHTWVFPFECEKKIQRAAGNNNKMESKKKGPNNCNCSSELFYFLFCGNLLLKQAFSLSLRSHKLHTSSACTPYNILRLPNSIIVLTQNSYVSKFMECNWLLMLRTFYEPSPFPFVSLTKMFISI